MISLIDHIEYLMMSHDCVIVPGWGALIAQYSDSLFNEEAGIINKPQRKVGFNASVSHNDGLLAQSIVRREGITYDEAMLFIANSVTTFKQQLSAGNEVSLGRLGFFGSDNGLVEFIPFYRETSNDEYYGLRTMQFKTLAQLRKEQELPASEVVETVVVRTSWARRAMQVAASIVVLLALLPVLTTPITRGDSYASLNLPEVKKVERTAFDWDSIKGDLAVTLPQQAIDAEKPVVAPQTEETLANEGGGRYYLIVSSLSNMKQVKEYLKYHRDINGNKPQVLKRGNKYRIYVARSNNASQLYRLKSALPERYNDAWVCD